MSEDLESDDELEDDGPTLKFIFGDEPDYREYLLLGELSPLSDLICYAICLPLDPEERSESVKCLKGLLELLINRATSDILNKILPAEGDMPNHWVSKKDFRKWIEEQDVELNRQYRAIEPLEPSQTKRDGKRINCQSCPFSSPPNTRDEWYEVIEDLMYSYKKQHQAFPTWQQTWSELWSSPPRGYGLSTGKDRFKEDALLMGGKSLNRNSLYKRFRRWSQKPQ